MTSGIKAPALDDASAYALRLADDALIYGQRLCEWCSAAPTLEEDLALANTALDYIGRARAMYQRAGVVSGQDEDDLAYGRDARQFGNLLLVELPRGDFANTIVRQMLLDVFEVPFLERLSQSDDADLAAIAAKGVKEARYHLRRSGEWVIRLGDGTPESHTRAQRALNELWGYLPELFEMDGLEQRLVASGIAVDRQGLEAGWLEGVATIVEEATLDLPDAQWRVRGGREGVHTEHLGFLLAEMQYMQRTYPAMQW